MKAPFFNKQERAEVISARLSIFYDLMIAGKYDFYPACFNFSSKAAGKGIPALLANAR